jgi:putative pyoverdin transport system ATP-binding/permease protein
MSDTQGAEFEERSRLGRRILGLLKTASGFRFVRPNGIPGLRFSSVGDLLAISLLSGGCGTGIIMVLNAEAQEVEKRHYSVALALGFVLLLVVYRWAKLMLIRRAATAIESALHEQRVSVSHRIIQLDLVDAEALTESAIVDGLVQLHESLSQDIVPLLIGFESFTLFVLLLAYLFCQSIGAGVLTLICAAVITQLYLARAGELQGMMKSASDNAFRLRRLAGEIAGGFKELRLHRRKQAEIEKDFAARSATVATQRSGNASLVGDLITTATSTSYLLGASVVFVLPILSGSHDGGLSRIVTTVLFLLGPLGGIVGAVQQLANARFALSAIDDFEAALDARTRKRPERVVAFEAFDRLHLRDVGFSYAATGDERPFAIHNVSIEARRGELVFVTGGNGSGKSTMLRVLTGLDLWQSGVILVDGEELRAEEIDDYRQLFSTVLSDFHIFSKPYGLDPEGVESVREYLQLLGIADKLPEDLAGGYDPQALSTGQKKRLALALALAENRPVLVLDEWAADQDPERRDFFYRSLLPTLRARGRAIIAVTHDDRYFDLADRRYHMSEGRLTLLRQNEESGS